MCKAKLCSSSGPLLKKTAEYEQVERCKTKTKQVNKGFYTCFLESAKTVREGFEKKKKLFPWNFPWRKIINFFPSIFQIFVLWYNRPETHIV